ncbi:unnamed protein product [Musa acuminata subsp. burmannicoides]
MFHDYEHELLQHEDLLLLLLGCGLPLELPHQIGHEVLEVEGHIFLPVPNGIILISLLPVVRLPSPCVAAGSAPAGASAGRPRSPLSDLSLSLDPILECIALVSPSPPRSPSSVSSATPIASPGSL